jgi:hypothetical protein
MVPDSVSHGPNSTQRVFNVPCKRLLVTHNRPREARYIKTRLIESNAKCRYLKKLTCKVTLRQVFYRSEAPPMTPPPLHTVYL